MGKSSKTLKTITISEIQYDAEEIEECLQGKTFYQVNVEVPPQDDRNEKSFMTLAEAEEYASEIAKRDLAPQTFNNMISGER